MIDAIAGLLGNLAEAVVLAGERLGMNATAAAGCTDITHGGIDTGLTSFINAALMPFIDKTGQLILNIGELVEKLADAMMSLA